MFRTCLEDGKDEETFTDEIVRDKQVFKKLPLRYWDNIHVTYEKSLDRRLYKRYPPFNHLLDNRMYLNILYDALQSPLSVTYCFIFVWLVCVCVCVASRDFTWLFLVLLAPFVFFLRRLCVYMI